MTETTPSQRPTDAPTLAGLPEPAALLFDLDGTLVDTVRHRIEAWSEALRRAGISVDPARLGGYIGSDGRWLAAQIALERGRHLDSAETEELDRVSGALFDELNVAPAPLPGATELLTALDPSRVTFAIATSSRPGQVAVSVGSLRLPSAPTVTDGSHVANAKPEPDLLLASAAQLGVAPEGCWYVGDSTWDMMASVKARMIAVGVTTGAVGAAELVAAGAKVVVADLTELLTELRRRGTVR